MPQNENENEALNKRVQELMQKRELEEKAKAAVKQLLEPAAYERLMNIKLSNAQLYEQLLSALIYWHKQGKLPRKLSEDELKQLVSNMLPKKRDSSIRRVSK